MISEERLNKAKKISLIGYMKDIHPTLCNERDDGTLSLKHEGHTMVIYDKEEPHSYTFGTVNKPYKDNIGTIRTLFGYGFAEAVEKLEDYASNSSESDAEPVGLGLFDNIECDSSETDINMLGNSFWGN